MNMKVLISALFSWRVYLTQLNLERSCIDGRDSFWNELQIYLVKSKPMKGRTKTYELGYH